MTTASKITLVRVAFIPVFLVFMYLSGGQSGLWMWLSLGVFILASLTDWIDGQIARKCNQVSDFGKFLDPLADKLLVLSAMLLFVQCGRMTAWSVMVVLLREFAVSGLRMVAAAKGKILAAGWSGKVKTAATMVGLCLMMAFMELPLLDTIVTWVIVVTTLYSGIEYFVKNWKCLGLRKG